MSLSTKLFIISGLCFGIGFVQHPLTHSTGVGGVYGWFGFESNTYHDPIFTILFIVGVICLVIGLVMLGGQNDGGDK